jgi:hypothetical protein
VARDGLDQIISRFNLANGRVHVLRVSRVPDAVQRLFDAAPQSRDPNFSCLAMDPGSAAHHAAKGGALRSIRGTNAGQVFKQPNSISRRHAPEFCKNFSYAR